MKNIEKQLLLKQIDSLYMQEEHEKITALIELFDSEHTDNELTLLLARSLLDCSVNGQDGMAQAAEAVLMMIKGGMTDPVWHYQLARSFFFRGRIVEAARELAKARSLAGANDKYIEIAADADELYNICLQELPQYSIGYTKDERNELLDFIDLNYGSISDIDIGKDEFGINIDIARIKADDERDYDILISMGLGSYNMAGYYDDDEDKYYGSELLAYIPSGWDNEKRRWINEYIRTIAALPVERRTGIAFGHMFSNGAPICPWTKMTASVLIEPQEVDGQAFDMHMRSGKNIYFHQIFPIYREEMEYKLSYGINSMIDKMEHISAVIDFDRENVCLRDDMGTTLLGREIDLAGKDGGKYCAVSRKIIDEGERVGYMRRHFDRGGDIISDDDSGWVFMSGTESREFLSNPYNIKRCRINTVCNIDSDILPFLNKPYNTIVYRKPDGVLTVINDPIGDSGSLPPS